MLSHGWENPHSYGWNAFLTRLAASGAPGCYNCCSAGPGYPAIGVPLLTGSVLEHGRAYCRGLQAVPSGAQRSGVVTQGSLLM